MSKKFSTLFCFLFFAFYFFNIAFGQLTPNRTTVRDLSGSFVSPNQFDQQPINAPGETYISNAPASSGVFIPEQYRSFITSPGLSTGPAEFAPPAINSIQSRPPSLSTSINSRSRSLNDGSAPSRRSLITGSFSLPCGPEGTGYRLCIPLLGVTFIENNLAGYINLIYQFVLGIAGLIVFGVIVYAGIQYTLSVGNPTLAGDALDMIKQAIIGLILLFLSYIILNTINPKIVHLKNPETQNAILPGENLRRQKAEGSVRNALKDVPAFLGAANSQEQSLIDQISRESDSQKSQELQNSLDELRAIRNEVEKRAAFKF